ncbi:hypothetical protein HN014_10875 [Aquimarina sp. TRL1]|uniref:hypothetical protein n=1 Tax=Aquimarina sp. (strain TRL1) TaxID=2736252 RepID=UPI0015894CE9|nr:hypothetical protein [Aquimarina sp. TRL1]QKX05396.1 hypothetical protein HN014_10875 [Aquimarina sp. TRL1]
MEKPGERLDYARKQLGLTYKALGEIVGITESGMRLSIVRNKLKEYHLNLISSETGINKEWVLTGKGDMLKNDIAEKEKPLFIGKNKQLEVGKFLDVFFLYEEIILQDERFKKYLSLKEQKAVIKYQHELLTKAQLKEGE